MRVLVVPAVALLFLLPTSVGSTGFCVSYPGLLAVFLSICSPFGSLGVRLTLGDVALRSGASFVCERINM